MLTTVTYVLSKPASQPRTMFPATGPAASVKLLTNFPIISLGGLQIKQIRFFRLKKVDSIYFFFEYRFTFQGHIETTKGFYRILLSEEDILPQTQCANQ